MYFVVCSIPATLCDVAPSATADAAQTSGRNAEGSMPLSQHQTGLQSGLGLFTAGSRMQQVRLFISYNT